MKRFNTGFKDNMWSLPGGRVEKRETLTQAACREAEEETGVSINPKNLSPPLIVYFQESQKRKIYAFFLTTRWKGSPYNKEKDKALKARWFPIKELPKNIIEHVKQGILAKIKGKTYLEIEL